MLSDLQADALFIDVRKNCDDTVRLVWRGRSNSQHPGKVLDPYLQGAVDEVSVAGQCIAMHFEELEYFNSSTVSSIIRFIRSAKERQVRVRFVYDGGRKWQKLSFDALRIFSSGDDMVFEEQSAAA